MAATPSRRSSVRVQLPEVLCRQTIYHEQEEKWRGGSLRHGGEEQRWLLPARLPSANQASQRLLRQPSGRSRRW